MVLNFYRKVHEQLETGDPLVVMAVIKSTGSSPGRQGFLQMVTATRQEGTIGGGIMEHKWVSVARGLLAGGAFAPFMKPQVHRPGEGENRSGMICSGEQVIAFYYLDKKDIPGIRKILSSEKNAVCYDEKGISIVAENGSFCTEITSENQWNYVQPLSRLHKVYIFGAGHVGLALCRALSVLDFDIHLFDDRKDLPQLTPGGHVQNVQLIHYEESSAYIPEENYNYVVVMSVGYRTDELILRSLYGRKFAYLGLLGSREKVKTLKMQLLAEGFDGNWLETINAPAGIDIKSETAEEIAVSITAQLVAVKNGRIG